ncbi:MAG: helix-turn-helix domain-containing protein [Clostridiales bacterium]|jgi:transcriptional regulator with XRE-family HTH domain|nr:helix-turn-helix domain-containing protein [Clostridiales bacterium]
MSNLKKQIGANIRYERISRNISIEELAEMLELSSAFVGLIERGQRGASVKNLIKISEIFSVSIDSLINTNRSNYSNLSENKENQNYKARLETINSLLYNLDGSELDFIISIIRSLKQLKHTYSE